LIFQSLTYQPPAAASRRKVRAKKALPPLLSEVGERCVLDFLPVVPDRLRAERVCRRWRRLIREELPVIELDFGRVAVRPQLRRDVSTMLERASRQLTRLVLPDITLVDAHVELVVQQRGLRVFRAHRCELVANDVVVRCFPFLSWWLVRRMQKKHIFNVLRRCLNLKVGRLS
jgi:hypothetical protein